MVSGNAAIASVPDAVGVQIVNTLQATVPGRAGAVRDGTAPGQSS
jgi:hypothetical protein